MDEKRQLGDPLRMREALSRTTRALKDAGVVSAEANAHVLVAHVLGREKAELLLYGDDLLSSAQRKALDCLVERRIAGEPLQYITGKAPLRLIELDVASGVLIPRPETEILVGEVLTWLSQQERPRFRIADIGCGSGAIACSLAFEDARITIDATDISPIAVETTRNNALRLGIADRVFVYEGNLGEPLGEESCKVYEAVVSNPPYIPTEVLRTLPSEVIGHEPLLALDGGADGLDVFRALLPWAHRALASGGLFAVELYEGSVRKAEGLAREAGFQETRLVSDLAGRDRVLLAWKGET